MHQAVVRSRGLLAMAAPEVAVEVHLSGGLPAFHIVGLLQTEVRESRERVRAAIQHLGFEFPNRKITVNLAPADLPKESGRFDLPIALGILCASGQLTSAPLACHEVVGELSLTGELRPIRGAVAMALAVRRCGERRTLLLPRANATDAALIRGVGFAGIGSLADAARLFEKDQRKLPLGVREHPLTIVGPAASPMARAGLSVEHGQPNPWTEAAARASATGGGSGSTDAGDPARAGGPDLSDVHGHLLPKRALEVAAAGEHSLLFVGPPGSGKSMLAERLRSILPALDDEQACEAAAVASLIGPFDTATWGRRPFRSPHHTASAAAMVGGGPGPRPGEISLAHHGVLFLDELPEFARPVLESLREPMESARVTVSRAARQVDFPARFQLVAAMNPCPCGYLGERNPADPSRSRCQCGVRQIQRYQARLSGPLLDRIDLRVEVPASPADALLDRGGRESSAVVRARVARALRQQRQRQGESNARLPEHLAAEVCVTDDAGRALLRAAVSRLGLSGRAVQRSLKVARTIADLAGAPLITVDHIAEALQYRRAPVPDCV
jgi:magnesium chelatase family protein